MSWYKFALPYLQVIIEIPYIFLEAVLFLTITYPAVNFYGSAYKVFWYFYTVFCTLLYYKYLGMMLVSLTPTYQVATIYASLFYTLLSLFSGYLMPGPVSQFYPVLLTENQFQFAIFTILEKMLKYFTN